LPYSVYVSGLECRLRVLKDVDCTGDDLLKILHAYAVCHCPIDMDHGLALGQIGVASKETLAKYRIADRTVKDRVFVSIPMLPKA